MDKKDLRKELKQKGYNNKAINDYFIWCKYFRKYKKEFTMQEFLDYCYQHIR